MLIKKSKFTLPGIALLAAMAIASCNNEPEKKAESAKDTVAPAPAPADTSKKADTTKIDTAKPRPIKNPG
ncbi:MAG: hypothetical protein EKK37_05945 [Sphingobacteriales bacterium]|nr:MAG: hypothetical protein EKK37_05945 [Sphingobacteriales bacterium]